MLSFFVCNCTTSELRDYCDTEIELQCTFCHCNSYKNELKTKYFLEFNHDIKRRKKGRIQHTITELKPVRRQEFDRVAQISQ